MGETHQSQVGRDPKRTKESATPQVKMEQEQQLEAETSQPELEQREGDDHDDKPNTDVVKESKGKDADVEEEEEEEELPVVDVPQNNSEGKAGVRFQLVSDLHLEFPGCLDKLPHIPVNAPILCLLGLLPPIFPSLSFFEAFYYYF